jgi:hypothetical protein
LVAPVAGGKRRGAAVALVFARSLESTAPLAAAAGARSRGDDLRLPPRDWLGAAIDRWRDRFRTRDGLEGAASGWSLAAGAGRQAAGEPLRMALPG